MTEKEVNFIKGRIWLITNDKGFLEDDIDTDMIYHNAHLAITKIEEMGKYAFGNLKGWQNFAKNAKPGDIVMAGRNFGAGSSRQQAVDCFISLGVKALICESFGAIYKRNALNSGFPILTIPNLLERLQKEPALIKHLQEVRVNLSTGEILSSDGKNLIVRANPMSQVQKDLYKVGGLLDFKP